MTLTTFAVSAAVTPTVVKTYVSHYTRHRKTRQQKPTASISYDEGLHLIRSFLDFASHHTVEELQTFTAQRVPHPHWVKVENITIPTEHLTRAAELLIEQLGPRGVERVGGRRWWQWRGGNINNHGGELHAEWIEMRADYNARQKKIKNNKGEGNGEGEHRCRRTMLYVHGGAYFFGSVDEHRYQIQRHARKLNARVLAPRYRLAPQFPFPCGLQDCLAAYLYMLTIQDPTEVILAGDSAGAGMLISVLCILRDQGLPLPAGAVFISPWVDLTHSFPSLVAGSDLDYIPPHGFMQKPSASWPPPTEDEIQALARGSAVAPQTSHARPRKLTRQDRKSDEIDAVPSFAVHDTDALNGDKAMRENPNVPAEPSDPNLTFGNILPGPGHPLSIEIDGKLVMLKDQIQMYATNELLSHPLVSPVLQPSLGGLPPILILTGGGEVLRDEQIYLAHKAANPLKYPLGDAYRKEYDPNDTILHKYRPTPVQLQVWDDLCHVAPTLSFTRPAKFMYRSVAQFGAWTLARAQKTSIEILDDDNISLISSNSTTTGTEMGESTDDLAKQHSQKNFEGTAEKAAMGKIGKAGSPLPQFKDHILRQRVNRHGDIFPLAPAHELPALTVPPAEIGVIKPGPVRKWMEAKKEWDGKYARVKRRVQKERLQDMSKNGEPTSFGEGENPPLSSLAGRTRRRGEDEEETKKLRKRKRKSYGLAMWSLWGSKHDENTLKRDEEVIEKEERRRLSVAKPDGQVQVQVRVGEAVGGDDTTETGEKSAGRKTSAEGQAGVVRSRSRRKTVTVIDAGQTDGGDGGEEPTNTEQLVGGKVEQPQPQPQTQSQQDNQTPGQDTTHLAPPPFISKFKTLTYLQEGRSGGSGGSELRDDSSSIRTGQSDFISAQVGAQSNASTMAVFSSPGVIKGDEIGEDGELLPQEGAEKQGPPPLMKGVRPHARKMEGMDTPVSRRSVERLLSNQDHLEGDVAARAQALRSPSAIAVVGAEGVARVVDDDGGGDGDDYSGTETSSWGGDIDRDRHFRNDTNDTQRTDSRSPSLPHEPEQVPGPELARKLEAVSAATEERERPEEQRPSQVQPLDPPSSQEKQEQELQQELQQQQKQQQDEENEKVQEAQEEQQQQQQHAPQRPGMYDRRNTDYHTAMEEL